MNIELKELINSYLELLHKDEHYHLTPIHRVNLYKVFGHSNYPDTFDEVQTQIGKVKSIKEYLRQADFTFSWLGIITAQKALPIWENSFLPTGKDLVNARIDLPHRMLMLAENVLNDAIDLEEAFYDATYGVFYHLSGNAYSQVNEKAAWACKAAYDALCLVFLGVPGMDYKKKCINLEDDYKFYQGCRDFAKMAVNSYSALDENPMMNRHYLVTEKLYKPVRFDVEKRLEFWEWWLTEAIPQAWELAEKSVADQK
jgi:hypothetical protein